MATQHQPLWEQYLKPLMWLVLDREQLKQQRYQINWEQECDRLSNPNVTYPTYYTRANFHGIENGYLSADAAVTYDPITQYVLPPQETWIRQSLIDEIRVIPRRILDLGCGTGSTTIMLKQAYPQAEVRGLDLSAYMLVMAEKKAQRANLDIQWHHGLGEQTEWESGAFDLVTATLLFHETPPAIAKAILQEAFRLLTPGGQCIILDGNQSTLRQTQWLTEVFEEPYIKAFAAGNLQEWMEQTGFESVEAQEVWWVHQVTSSIKPLPIKVENPSKVDDNLGSRFARAF